jgi:hypothetical protein
MFFLERKNQRTSVRLGAWGGAIVIQDKDDGCVFRRKPAGDSDAFQPVIPTEASQ